MIQMCLEGARGRLLRGLGSLGEVSFKIRYTGGAENQSPPTLPLTPTHAKQVLKNIEPDRGRSRNRDKKRPNERPSRNPLHFTITCVSKSFDKSARGLSRAYLPAGMVSSPFQPVAKLVFLQLPLTTRTGRLGTSSLAFEFRVPDPIYSSPFHFAMLEHTRPNYLSSASSPISNRDPNDWKESSRLGGRVGGAQYGVDLQR
ncbi:hypothetical protein C8R47DRAFT_1204613 [Mycena vitilis]|nr:hypothetical protein C8R47DRAFT_1204613 [Mycena vitilis]